MAPVVVNGKYNGKSIVIGIFESIGYTTTSRQVPLLSKPKRCYLQ